MLPENFVNYFKYASKHNDHKKRSITADQLQKRSITYLDQINVIKRDHKKRSITADNFYL